MEKKYSKDINENGLLQMKITKKGNKIYRTPSGYTSDILVFVKPSTNDQNNLSQFKIMLIQRKNFDSEGNPNIEGGKWAIPGGFVNKYETALEAASRELMEETNVDNLELKHFGVYDKSGRDPRGWVISNVHYTIVDEEALKNRKANDDAKEVRLFTINEALKLELAFDHSKIILDAIDVLKEKCN